MEHFYPDNPVLSYYPPFVDRVVDIGEHFDNPHYKYFYLDNPLVPFYHLYMGKVVDIRVDPLDIVHWKANNCEKGIDI